MCPYIPKNVIDSTEIPEEKVDFKVIELSKIVK